MNFLNLFSLFASNLIRPNNKLGVVRILCLVSCNKWALCYIIEFHFDIMELMKDTNELCKTRKE